MNFNHREEHIDDGMVMIEANIDDMNPEHCSYVLDRLFDRGANDAYWTSIIMKKGRPGLCLHVLADQAKLEDLKEEIFRQTTTIGLRYYPLACHRLGRRLIPVDTPWGTVHIKTGIYQGEEINAAPEHGECEQLARQHHVPVKRVYDAAKAEYMRMTRSDSFEP